MAKTDQKGWWINQRNESVHPDLIRPNEKLKDEMVEKLIEKAKAMRKAVFEFRKAAEEDVESYFALLLQEYGMDEKSRSKKGNLTLENFSSTARVEIRIQETLTFDEKLQVAKLKVDEFLDDVTKESSPTIRTLVTKAFEVDKEGKIDAKKIFALKSYDISDPRWVEAMGIIDESKKVSHRKPYIRFYDRESVEDSFQNIAIDLAQTR